MPKRCLSLILAVVTVMLCGCSAAVGAPSAGVFPEASLKPLAAEAVPASVSAGIVDGVSLLNSAWAFSADDSVSMHAETRAVLRFGDETVSIVRISDTLYRTGTKELRSAVRCTLDGTSAQTEAVCRDGIRALTENGSTVTEPFSFDDAMHKYVIPSAAAVNDCVFRAVTAIASDDGSETEVYCVGAAETEGLLGMFSESLNLGVTPADCTVCDAAASAVFADGMLTRQTVAVSFTYSRDGISFTADITHTVSVRTQ